MITEKNWECQTPSEKKASVERGAFLPNFLVNGQWGPIIFMLLFMFQVFNLSLYSVSLSL